MRNITKAVPIAVLVILFGFVTDGYTVSTTSKANITITPITPVELGTDVNNIVFTGTVKRIPNGTVLITKKATYLLSGGNFDSVIGKEVNIVGRIEREGSIEKIVVSRAQLAQQ